MFNFSSNVGSNWGLPAGYTELLAKAKSFSPIVGIGEAAVKYGEQSNKLSALQKGLSTTVSEYGKLAGLSKEQLAGFLTPHDNESRTDHIARLQAVADYLPRYMQKSERDKQQSESDSYGAWIAGQMRNAIRSSMTEPNLPQDALDASGLPAFPLMPQTPQLRGGYSSSPNFQIGIRE